MLQQDQDCIPTRVWFCFRPLPPRQVVEQTAHHHQQCPRRVLRAEVCEVSEDNRNDERVTSYNRGSIRTLSDGGEAETGGGSSIEHPARNTGIDQTHKRAAFLLHGYTGVHDSSNVEPETSTYIPRTDIPRRMHACRVHTHSRIRTHSAIHIVNGH
jgi:hypothetical protein